MRGAARYLRQAAARSSGARGATSLALAATVAALMVAANTLIDSWSDGHLLAAWLVLWVAPLPGIFVAAGAGLLASWAVAGRLHPRLGAARPSRGGVPA